MRRYFTAALCAATFALLSATSARAAIVIDSFDTTQRHDTDPASSATPSGTATTAGSDILGGERDVSVVQNAGLGYVRLSINPAASSLALYSEDSDSDGAFRISYDGVDGNASVVNHTGLGGINLSAEGDRFTFQNIRNSAGTTDVAMKLTVYSDADNYLEASFVIPEGQMGDLDVLFSSFTQVGSGSFSNVGAIVWDGDTNGATATDFNLDSLIVSGNGSGGINVIPEPSSLLLLSLGAVGLAGFRRRRKPEQTQS